MILKEENGYRYSLIGFKEKKWFETEMGYLQMRGREISFSGSKSELLQMPEEFWREVCEFKSFNIPIRVWGFKVFSEDVANHWDQNHLSSIHSAIESEPGEYYLIIKEKL